MGVQLPTEVDEALERYLTTATSGQVILDVKDGAIMSARFSWGVTVKAKESSGHQRPPRPNVRT